MTFRAKPVVKRTSRPSWESRDRRNFLLNVGFGLVVVAALLILLIAIAYAYYDTNLASVGSVNGQGISKQELRERYLIEEWRLDEAERRIRTQVVAGRLTQAQADQQNQIILQQREQLGGIALERLIDDRIQAELAEAEGITITDEDVTARLAEEATTAEARRAWVIEVEPEVSEGATEPTAAQVSAARDAAAAALSDLQSGTPWEEVAQTVSTDTSTASQGGDLGWIGAEDSRLDEAYVEAVFGLAVDTPSEVIEGEDGIFRIARVTEIAPESVDGAYEDKLVNDDVDLERYRAVVRGDAVRQKLEDKVVAAALEPGPQRRVAEIFIRQSDIEVPETAVKVRHILYSPKDDPQAASAGEIPEDDPAWTQAKTDADAAYARLQDDPSLFDSIARAESDESSARGTTGSGGKLPGYVTEDSGYVEEFLEPLMQPNLRDGQVLAPFRTDFGWHVVQVMYHPTDAERLAALKEDADGGADFAQLARDNSESSTAGSGGEVGWVARAQLDQLQATAIFEAELGSTTDPVIIPDQGGYLYKVFEEETRTPEGRQADEIRATAFRDWYELKKLDYEIKRDPGLSGVVE
jgi:parvulin-like peptidyl-prolyl isomerase